MEIAIVVVAIIISLLWLLYQVGGAGAVIIVIILLIFVGYKLLHFGKNSKKYYEDSEYIEKAIQFMEFYETISCYHYLVITDYRIAAIIDSANLGVAVMSYLKSNWNSAPTTEDYKRYKKYQEEKVYEELQKLTGPGGMEIYKKLQLKFKDHNDDDDYATVYQVLSIPHDDRNQIQKYADALSRCYKRKYGKNIKIYVWNDSNL